MALRLASLLLVAALACGGDVDPPRAEAPTTRAATFAAVVAELAVARAQLLPDTAAYRAQRDAILARHGVSAGQLRAYGASFGGNEDVMSRVYEGVGARVDTMFGSGAVAPPSTGVAPPEDMPPVEVPSVETVPAAPDTTAAAVPDTTAAAVPDTS